MGGDLKIKVIIKFIKITINMFIVLILLIFIAIFIILNPIQNTSYNNQNTIPFKLNGNSITYDKNNITPTLNSANASKALSTSTINNSNLTCQEILNKAKAMVEVKWSPKYNVIDKYGPYVFIKGRSYYGIPYSMNLYQISSVNDFLSKVSSSKILYGNDCSGFVSVAWGVSRQTTLTLFNAVKNGSKIDGKTVSQISWNDLEAGDALLFDNGKGDGHIMLYINSDSKNNDKLNVYEQDVQTIIPFEPLPLARKDVRYKSTLMKEGYIPIRLLIPPSI